MLTLRLPMAFFLMLFVSACYAEASGEPRTLTVNGTGSAATAPDTAVLTIGVESFAKTATEAMADNARRANALLKALRDRGIAERDLQTSALNLNARYDHRRAPDNGPAERILLGYDANNMITARVRELDKLGAAIDAAIAAGGNRIDGVNFDISDPTAVLAAAREAAWENARAKAEQLASLAGVKLGAVQKIESYEHSPGPVRQVGMMRMAAESTPVQPGEQQLSVQINVVWLLE